MKILGVILILILVIIGIVFYGRYHFDRLVQSEIALLLETGNSENAGVVTPSMVSNLPEPVQKWLNNCGILGKERIQTVHLRQQLWMKLKPEQENWSKATAEQYFNVESPGFIWKLHLNMFPGVSIIGRDKFIGGKGSMLMKIAGLFVVAKEENNEKINEGALQRFLSEIIWFPSAALSPHISWESIDETSARATMAYQGTTGSGIFYFDTNGNLKQFIAMRYRGSEAISKREKWVCEIMEIKEMNGISIPTKAKVIWGLEEGDWTWLKLEITEINFNI